MCRPGLDIDILPFEIAVMTECLAKRSQRLWASDKKETDPSHPLALLRLRRERPRGRRAAEQRDERAADHSITLSARASSVGGTSRPSTFAVFRLITSSNLTGA